MDRRGWPWKKKSSEKTAAATGSVNQGGQDNLKEVVTQVLVSQEKYAYLTGLEDQVKVLSEKLSASNEKLSSSNEKLSNALSELTAKDDLVKQHTKVAEEAVSGWERTEAESLALKTQLESLTLLKLSADERAAHLDGALKECVKEVRYVKEEAEQKLHDVVFAKTRQWEKVKLDLEAKANAFEQELLRTAAENDALSRTLQERSNLLMKLSEEKSQAEAEIEVLKTNIKSYEREIDSLKYEVHLVSKELEIRNEEKNMSFRSVDAANKQHLEDVKKITKLEAECHRLRGLVRKRLPGPAALTQMKLEVESFGRDHNDSRPRRSPSKNSSPRVGLVSEFTMDNMQHCRRENELLTARLLEMEEETQMLKEALAKRNTELQASRSMFAKTANRLRSIESLPQGTSPQDIISKFMSSPIPSFLGNNESYAPSVVSMSEDGIDEDGMFAASSSAALTPDRSHHGKERSADNFKKNQISNQMDLMDDFLEMEKLACVPAGPNDRISSSDGVAHEAKDGCGDSASLHSSQPMDISNSNGELAEEMDRNLKAMSKLQARLSEVFNSHHEDDNLGKVISDIGRILHELQKEFPELAGSCIIEEVNMQCNQSHNHDGKSNGVLPTKACPNEDIIKAVGDIHDFVIALHGESKKLQMMASDTCMEDEDIQAFSAVIAKFTSNELSGDEVILALSSVLLKVKRLDYLITAKVSEEESITTDCIDKATLLENSVLQREHVKEGLVDSSSNPEVPQEVLPVSGSRVCSIEDFERVQREKDTLVLDLTKCMESLEQTKALLHEMEQQVSHLKSDLSKSEKSNSLAETQLKCMAESYNSLEVRFKDMKIEIDQLRTQVEMLSNELRQERQAHLDDLEKCRDLQELLERNQKALHQYEMENESKSNQEREIAAAAEKLAQCQETIFLLGRQLKTLQPQTDLRSPSPSGRHSTSSNILEDVANNSASKPNASWQYPRHPDRAELDNLASILQQTEGHSPSNVLTTIAYPSDIEANQTPSSPVSSKRAQHRSSLSSSSSSISTPEKHSRGFSRFFSKGKSN